MFIESLSDNEKIASLMKWIASNKKGFFEVYGRRSIYFKRSKDRRKWG